MLVCNLRVHAFLEHWGLINFQVPGNTLLSKFNFQPPSVTSSSSSAPASSQSQQAASGAPAQVTTAPSSSTVVPITKPVQVLAAAASAQPPPSMPVPNLSLRTNVFAGVRPPAPAQPSLPKVQATGLSSRLF